MIKVLLDQNFDQRISRGLPRRVPSLDIETTANLGIQKFTDDKILAMAAELGRVVFTQDEKTFSKFAYERISRNEKVARVVVVPDSLSIGEAIEELELILRCRSDNEWPDKIDRLPL